LAFDYLAPSAWASIGAIAAKLDETSTTVSRQGERLDDYKEEVKTTVDHQVILGREDFYKQLEDFKLAFIQATRGLGGRLDNVKLRMVGMSNTTTHQTIPKRNQRAQPHPVNNANAGPTNPNQQERIVIGDDHNAADLIGLVETRVDDMERKLSG
jgi:hypothetical protein